MLTLTLVLHALGATFAHAQTTETLLKEAMALTAQRKLPEAERRYQQLMEAHPQAGLPAYSRFLARTGRTTEAAALLQAPQASALSPLNRARTAVAGSLTSEAVASLREQPVAGEEYQQALLLANQLQQIQKLEEAATVLAEAVQHPSHAPLERRDLFRKLTRLNAPWKVQAALPPILDTLVTTHALTYPQLREMTIDALNLLAQQEGYAEFQHQAERQRGESPAKGWLFALTAVKRGDTDQALQQLETLTTASLTAPQRAVIDEELARLLTTDQERQLRLYENLLTVASDQDRIRVTLSQMLFRQRRYDKVAEVLQPVDPAKLDDSQLQIYKNVRLAVGAMKDPNATIAQFEKEAAGLTYERLREIAQAPLATLKRNDLDALRQALSTRLNGTTAPAELHVLLMSVENSLGNADGVTAALQNYSRQNPQNLEAASELAEALSQRAYQVATADPLTSPPTAQLEQAANGAAEALWQLIEARPYVPEPYEKLIAIYKLYGQPDKARKVTNYLTDSTTATAEEIQLAAYIMATNGMSEEAVPVYERALKLRPDHTLFRLNYAGALSRVGRLPEADAIYRDIIEHGVNGRQYHAHEVYANGLLLARNNGYLPDFLAFLKGLIPKHDMPQHDYFLLEAGKVLFGLKMYNEAVGFFNAVEVQYPEKAWEAREQLVALHMETKEFDRADQVLAETERESTDTLGLVLARTNRAVVQSARGDLDGAVELWKKIAEEFPKDRQAARGLLTGAQKLVEAGKFSQANTLLNRYLALDTGDADGEVSARELMQRIKSLDVSPNTILRSAIEEAAPKQ